MSAPPQQLWGFPAESFPRWNWCTALHVCPFQPQHFMAEDLASWQRNWPKNSVKAFARVLPLHHELDHMQVFTLWFSSCSWKLAKGHGAGSLGLQKITIHVKRAATNQVIHRTISEAVLCSCFPAHLPEVKSKYYLYFIYLLNKISVIFFNWLNIHFFQVSLSSSVLILLLRLWSF